MRLLPDTDTRSMRLQPDTDTNIWGQARVDQKHNV